ncbi:MAG: tetratricopeptide repeat protein [Terracidiphilus sp.]|jgi:tetratricopeptide (TPR) repeat protein
MSFNPIQFAHRARPRWESFRAAAWCALLAIAPLMPPAAGAQAAARHGSPAGQPRPAQDNLEARLAAAEAARNSGDTVAIARANYLVIGAALREIADLRAAESEYAKAIELYRDSLQYEETPGAYASMAFAEIQAGDLDKAIQFAQKALAADPGNLRAERILASGLAGKGEYAQAVEPFTRIAQAEPTIDNQYLLLECLLETRKPEDKARALAVFERMKKSAGDNGSLHVLLGRAYRDAGDIQAAIGEFQRAIAIDPRTPHAHYFFGLAQLVQNDWKPTPGAEAALRTEAEYFPQDYLANYMLGFLTAGDRKYEESNKYLLAAAKISPSSPDPFLYLGLNAFAEGKMDIAEKWLRKAVELTGEKDEPRGNYQIRRAYVDLSRILFSTGRQEESEVFAAKARQLQNKVMVDTQQSISAMMAAKGSGDAAAVVPLTRQQEDQSAPAVQGGGDPFARSRLTPEQLVAAQAREKALRPALALAFNDLGTSEAMGGEYALALGNYQRAEQWDEGLPGLEKNLGVCAFRVKDYAEAVRALALALTIQPDSSSLRAMLGASYFAINRYAEAAQTFAPLGARGMRDSETGYAWAASLTHTGDLAKATEVLTAFESEPRPNDMLLLVGQLWTEIGDYARAIAALQRALASDPNLPMAHHYMGLAYIHWEHWPEAEKEFQAELALNPGDPVAEYHLGFVYLQQSKVDEAAALFSQVIAAQPEYANAQYQLGKILVDRGQFADAVGHLEAAARLSPQADYMHYQLQAVYRKLGRSADADRELEIYKDLKAKARERMAEKLKQTQ